MKNAEKPISQYSLQELREKGDIPSSEASTAGTFSFLKKRSLFFILLASVAIFFAVRFASMFQGLDVSVMFINFLMGAQAQARKADIAVWGDPTVLALDQLPSADRAAFAAKPLPGQVQKPAPAIPEPHGSWVDPIEKGWTKRYGQ